MTATAIVPKSWYSWDFSMTRGDRTLARLDLSSWRERAAITIGDSEHRAYRESALGDFVIEHGGQVLARAGKPSAFRNTMIVRHEGREYTLKKKSAWRRAFIVLDGEHEIGSISPTSAWRRDATVDLPAPWPLPLQAFVIWLAVMLWKREADSGG
jgi:hypothetical protein